jgi:hypothetical protein
MPISIKIDKNQLKQILKKPEIKAEEEEEEAAAVVY